MRELLLPNLSLLGNISGGPAWAVPIRIADLQVFFPGTGGSGGSGASLSGPITQVGHGLVVGNVVRLSGPATYAKAQADTAANAEVVGIVAAVIDADHFTLCWGGLITGLAGLTAAVVYYLSPTTAGVLTATGPSTVGQVSKPLLWADTTTSGYFFNMRGQVLSAGGGTSVSRVVGAQWEATGAITVSSTKPVDRSSPSAGTIKSVTVLTYGGTGSCSIGIKKNPYSAFPPTTNIVAAAPPTIATGVKYQDAVLTGWTTAVAANDVFRFSLDTNSGFSRVAVTLEIQ